MPSPNATPTPITPPRVPMVDPRTGLIDRAWYLFFLSLNDIATTVVDDLVGPNSESLIASYDAALQSLAQTVETQPLPIDLSADLAALKQEVETAPRLEIGTIASQNAENVNITGGKISGLVPPLPTASGGTALSSFTSGGAMYATSTTALTTGTLPVASGGTGQTTFTNGQLLIGNSTGNTLSKATLTAGTNITINNGAGSITIDASFSTTGSTGSVTLAKITALGTDGSLTFSNGLITAFTAPT
jgi:hypothetical protein